MKYDTLKALVNAKVYENTEQEITGGDMNNVLQSVIASLGAHYQMGGLVSPNDQITVGDEPVVFLATTPGTYTYFGGLVVADGEVALLVWSGTAWSKQTPDISTRTEVNQLGQNMQSIEDAIVCLDFSNPQNGKYYVNDGTTASDNSWVCKEIDVSKYKGRDVIVRLGFHVNDVYYYDNKSYIKTSDNNIVALSSCIVDNISTINDCITIHLPNDADKLLASWAIDDRYSVIPFGTISRLPIYNESQVESQIQAINEQVATLKTNSESFGYFDFSEANQKKKYNSNGEIVNDNSYACKEFDVSGFKGKIVILRAGFIVSGAKYYLNDSYVKKEDTTIVAISTLQFNDYSIPFDGVAIKLPNNADKLLLSWATDERYLVKPYCYVPYALTELSRDVESYSDISYIAIGDSITKGTGATSALGSYAARLNAYFGFGRFVNMGSGGASVIRQGTSPYNTYPIMKTALESAYLDNFRGIITVSLGTNDYGNGHSPLGSIDDIKDVPFASLTPTSSEYIEGYTFVEGFRYNLERMKQLSPYATIVVLLPIHRVGEDYEYLPGVTLQSYRDMEIEVCKLLGIPYIDMTLCQISKWNTNPIWSADNLHPNDYGYYLMTSYLIPFFKELINQQRYLNNSLE